MASRAAPDRFWRRVSKGGPEECWPWIGWRNAGGYGIFSFGNRGVRAHRYSWELVNGPIPAGLQIDHLCRNRACQNPAHMEIVTNRENALRGVGITATRHRQTRCVNGHPFDAENTELKRSKWGLTERRCKTCKRQQDRDRRARHRLEARA